MVNLIVTPGMTAFMRHEADRFMLHLYDRRRRTFVYDLDGAVTLDDYGIPVTTLAPAEVGLPCFYQTVDVVRILGDAGNVVVNRPIVSVPSTDPVADGDVVSNIRTRDGKILVLGPNAVENITPQGPDAGGDLFTDFTLRSTENVPVNVT